jgi:enoyl-[acyl-carrier protein] reductase III
MPATEPNASTPLPLDGLVALVTGASRGLGRAIAQKLCSCGCHVYLNYVSSDVVAKKAAESLVGLRGSATLAKGDVRDPDALTGILDTIRGEHGRLDVFVHNAATFQPMLAIAPSVDAFHQEQELALDPLLRSASTLAKLMDGWGRIIAISGNGATEVIPNYVATGVAKAALENLVRYLAVDLAPFGVTVNSVRTHLLDKGADTSNPEIAGLLASRTPNGRLTRPADVADVVALLCRPEAAWLQGQVITVDGGLGLRA